MKIRHIQISQIIACAGVYVGCMYQEYLDVQVRVSQKAAPQAVTGNGLSFMVGRLSFTFDFSGPCISTDTACSSSLVSTHLACKVRQSVFPKNQQSKDLIWFTSESLLIPKIPRSWKYASRR